MSNLGSSTKDYIKKFKEKINKCVFSSSLPGSDCCVTCLVRFGGAGAVFPRLFVVRRIWTFAAIFPPVENVLSFDVVEPVSNIKENFVKKNKKI